MSLVNSEVLNAISFAAIAHAKQTRKYNGHPYIVHPIDVVDILNVLLSNSNLWYDFDYSDRVHMLIAAALHDTIEDTDVTAEDITKNFNAEVTELVVGLTNVSKLQPELNRAQRKQLDAENLSKQPVRVQIIKVADIYSNTSAIVEEDPVFAKKYISEKLELIEYLTKLPVWLIKELKTHLLSLQQKLQQKENHVGTN